jgi:hypothetical protein
MKNLSSLEAERQTILARMQANREQYRRMLMDNTDSSRHTEYQGGHHAATPTNLANADTEPAYSQSYMHSFSDYSALKRNPALLWMKEHPWICVGAVAALVAIGPRRITRAARSVAASGTALTALTLRNQQNVQMLGRLISTVVNYVQSERTRPRG